MENLTSGMVKILAEGDSSMSLHQKMGLCGLMTSEERKRVDQTLPEALDISKRYLSYRLDPERTIFICSSETEWNSFKIGEEHFNGIPFVIGAEDVLHMLDEENQEYNKNAVLNACADEEKELIKTIAITNLNTDDRIIRGYYKTK